MKRILFPTIILFLFSMCVSAQKSLPSYKEVVNEFFNRYDLKESQDFQFIRFVKNQKGYYIEEYNKKKDTYVNQQLFWSSKSGKYKKLKFPKSQIVQEETIQTMLSGWEANFYDLYPYYAYVNWEKDVIRYYESKEPLNADEIYALARSYSCYASNLLNNNSGYSESGGMFHLKEYGQSQLNQDKLITYRHLRHKAIETFEKLCKLNPDYPTIIGNICLKADNEYVNAFLDLRIYHNDSEAIKELPDDLYTPFYLEMAKNYLNSCDSNAILFTNADNDTYPLLYLQAKKKYRSDVLIINLSLLNNNNYINHFRYGKIGSSDSLHLTLSPESHEGMKLAVNIVKQNSKEVETVSLSEAIQLIEDKSPQTVYTDNPDYRYLVSNKLRLLLDSSRSIVVEIKEPYISKGDLMALDIISSNISQRPICFIYNTSLGLSNNLEMNGFVYKLVDSTDLIKENQLYAGVNADKTFQQLMHNFSLGNPVENDRYIFFAYQQAFSYLASYYAKHSEKDSCRMVIDKYLSLLPNETYAMSWVHIPMIKAAYKVSLTEKGNAITEIIIKNLNEMILSGNLSGTDIEVIKYTVNELKQITNNTSILEKIEILIEKL